MTGAPPLPDLPERELKAIIEPRGKYWYRVYLLYGWTRYGPDGWGWHVFSHRLAVRKAQRELKRLAHKLHLEELYANNAEELRLVDKEDVI